MPAYRTRDNNSRSLEVTTESAKPPSVAIISPTPRAFSFPANAKHPNDSPYSSPSSSPFEPDLKPLALTCTPPPPPLTTIMHTLSPPSTDPHAPSPTSLSKRRKSLGTELERRPKRGDEDYIKRPENAFILFRRKCCEDRQQAHEEAATSADGPAKKQRQADLSKTISQQWKSLPAEERQYWEELAKEKKKEHEQMYPNYVYRPQRTKGKDDKSKGKKAATTAAGKGRRGSECENDNESLSFILPLPSHNRHGRSASAPTPPLNYSQITVPNVYMPSCPTSPSLMPMIARRASHPGHHAVISHFDFVPTTDNLMSTPPTFTSPFEQGMQSNSLMEMFNMSGQPSLADRSLPLQSLDIPGDQALLMSAQQQMVSPASSIASGSSGPPSPGSAPFTPRSSYSLAGSNDNACSPSSLLLDPQSTDQLQIPDLGYGGMYGWGENMPVLADGGVEDFLPEDLDINTIPPIELTGSLLKYDGGDLTQVGGPSVEGCGFGSGAYQQPSFEGLFEFSELIAGQGY